MIKGKELNWQKLRKHYPAFFEHCMLSLNLRLSQDFKKIYCFKNINPKSPDYLKTQLHPIDKKELYELFEKYKLMPYIRKLDWYC